MSNFVYPGFQLLNVDPCATEQDVVNFFVDVFKGVGLRDEGIKVELHQNPDEETKVASVFGVMISMFEIRQGIMNKKLGNTNVHCGRCLIDLPRIESALDDRTTLESRLVEGLGMTPAIQLFKDDFVVGHLGGLMDISHRIRFAGKIIPGKESMLRSAGKLLQLVESLQSGTEEYMDMEFLYRLEAVQAICLLNNNPSFSIDGGAFLTPKNPTKPKNCGLGVNGETLNINSLVGILGYVPFEAMDESIIDSVLLQAATPECWTCGSKFKLVGVDPDLSFVAATCKCLPENSKFVWGSERFFRLNVDKSVQHCLRLKLAVQGIQPLFEDINHFEKSAVAAELIEMEYRRQLLGIQNQVLGTIQEAYKIDEEVVNGKVRLFWRVEVEVKATNVWSPEGLKLISRCNLLHVVEGVDKNTPEARNRRYRTKGISGRVFKIYTSQVPDTVRVIMQVVTSFGDDITANQKMWLIPRPPSIKESSIRRSLSKWRAFNLEREKKNPEKIPATIINATKLTNYPRENFDHSSDVWEVLLDLQKHPYWKKGHEGAMNDYLAADMDMKVYSLIKIENEVVKVSSRIVVINMDDTLWTATAVVFISPSQTILSGEDCSLSMWRCVKLQTGMDLDQYKMPRGLLELDSDEENEDIMVDEERVAKKGTGNLSNDVSLKSDFEACCVVRKSFDGPLPRSYDLGKVLDNWLDRPTPMDLSLLDLLLLKTQPTISHSADLPPRRPTPMFPHYMRALKTLHSLMNESQLEGIRKSEKKRVSIIHGGAGTGKTQMCASIAIHLLCLKPGVVVLTADSELSADHLCTTILGTLKSLNLRLSVTRMLSMKEEQVSLQKKDRDGDLTNLHEAVKEQLLFATNDIVDYIKDRDESFLRYNERKLKLSCVRQMEHETLLTSRIIVATVNTAGDGRLESLTAEWRENPSRHLTAIVVDEATMVSVPEIIPLLALQPERVVLVGDDAQPHKIVLDETAIGACLDVSWMTLLRMTPYCDKNNVVTLLDQQYRMCSQIASIVSQYAYGGHLNSHTIVQTRDYKENLNFSGLREMFPELGNSNVAIYTYDEINAETPGESLSFKNAKEAGISLDLVKKLLAVGIELNSIVVLSMYDSHARLIKENGKKLEFLNDLEVCTIETFQGREKSIVILNLVRSNTQNNVGLLRDKNRLVVGLSRALDYLMIVGDIKTIEGSNNPDLVGLIENMKQSGAQIISQ